MARKSSRRVALGAIPLLSSIVMAACGTDAPGPVQAVCVTEQNGDYVKVDESLCPAGGGGPGVYFWNYGGTVSGNRVHHGTMTRPRDREIKTSSGRVIQRGGFGGSSVVKGSTGGS